MRAKTMTNDSPLPSWDLTDLYTTANSVEFKADLASLASQVQTFNELYKGRIGNLEGKQLSQAIKSYEIMQSLIIKAQSFAFLNYATDVNDQDRKVLLQSTEEKVTSHLENLIFFQLELNKISDADLEKKYKISPNLVHYKSWISKVRIWKKYELTEAEEKVLLQKELTSNSAWIKFYDQYQARLRFDFADQKLNFSEIVQKLSSHSEEDRKYAAQSISKVFAEHSDTFNFIFNTIVKDKELDDLRRGFIKPISARNLSNYIDDQVVYTLIATVKKNYPKLSHRYFKIKAKLLGKNKLNYWDRNAPISIDQEANIAWDEAVDIVLTAYKKFSPTFAKIAQQFLDNNWIDAQVKPSKMHGAFAHPTSATAHPYIMLNYQNKNRDVMTLAHELGHGIHQMLAKEQGELLCQTPLTLAETASVFGEQLVFRSLLEREKDPKKKKLLIAGKVEDMLNTVVRQIALCEFERQVHDKRRESELSNQDFADIWLKTQKESFGDAIKIDESYSAYWMYISHFFHTPFYVYAYAFGDCLVNSLYFVYEQGLIKNFEDKYINMLAAGGKFAYKDLQPIFGLDPNKADFWQQGLDKISELIDLLEKN